MFCRLIGFHQVVLKCARLAGLVAEPERSEWNGVAQAVGPQLKNRLAG